MERESLEQTLRSSCGFEGSCSFPEPDEITLPFGRSDMMQVKTLDEITSRSRLSEVNWQDDLDLN